MRPRKSKSRVRFSSLAPLEIISLSRRFALCCLPIQIWRVLKVRTAPSLRPFGSMLGRSHLPRMRLCRSCTVCLLGRSPRRRAKPSSYWGCGWVDIPFFIRRIRNKENQRNHLGRRRISRLFGYNSCFAPGLCILSTDMTRH